MVLDILQCTEWPHLIKNYAALRDSSTKVEKSSLTGKKQRKEGRKQGRRGEGKKEGRVKERRRREGKKEGREGRGEQEEGKP